MKEEVFKDLVGLYAERVYNIALRITCSPQDAEDIVQETFLTVFQKFDDFRGESNMFTWIYRIAVNTSLQYRTRVTEKTFINLDQDVKLASLPEEVVTWESNPEDLYLVNELTAQISRECTYFMTFKLSYEQRIVFILRTILGFSYQQISDILDIPISSVKARLNRARNNLIKYFKGQCQYLNKHSTCSCKSKIGYTVSLMPQILDRVRKHSSKEADHLIRSSLDKIPRSNSSFKHLLLFDYDARKLIESFYP